MLIDILEDQLLVLFDNFLEVKEYFTNIVVWHEYLEMFKFIEVFY